MKPELLTGASCIKDWRPDYRKYLGPEILYIPYILFAPHTPLKKKKKKLSTVPSKGHPRAHTLAEFEEKFPEYFFHFMQINVGTP